MRATWLTRMGVSLAAELDRPYGWHRVRMALNKRRLASLDRGTVPLSYVNGKLMERFFAVAGAVAAMLGVIIGAFGAHGLRGRLSPADLEIFETGVRYHMYHALGLFAVAWAASRWPSGVTTLAGWLLIVGIIIFSGSLYTLVLTGQRWLGAITPIGGVALVAGWAALAWAALRS